MDDGAAPSDDHAPGVGADAPAPGLLVDAAGHLAAIADPALELVVWRRELPALERLLDPLPPEALPDLRLPRVASGAVVDELVRGLGRRADALWPLIADAAALAGLYTRVTGRETIQLRLERVDDDACRRFHVDRVLARLLCTYRGPGTQWIPAAEARKDDRGHVVEPAPARIRRLARLDVALLKGASWPGGRACVHRSPPILGTRTVRLLLCIDDGHGG